jgi:hypothetical protein
LYERAITHRYLDPLDEIWLEAARGVGLRVARDRDVFAATDGRGHLWLAPPSALDADDCLAQMILHELCHSLIMGRESFSEPDWGLDNETDRHRGLEHACLRLQAALLEPWGLREVLAPTTDYRAFYDALGPDPFAATSGAPDDGCSLRARVALRRSEQSPWAPHLGRALSATADVLGAVARVRGAPGDAQRGAPDGSGADGAVPNSLAARLRPRALPHPSGGHRDPVAGRTCADCGWFDPASGACRQAARRVDGHWPSCERFEGPLECSSCGACCREAYHLVLVGPQEPAPRRHPELFIIRDDGSAELRRPGGRCLALRGGAPLEPALPTADPETPEPPLHRPNHEPFACAIYDERPKTCRDFTRGSENCLEARRRVGLSR